MRCSSLSTLVGDPTEKLGRSMEGPTAGQAEAKRCRAGGLLTEEGEVPQSAEGPSWVPQPVYPLCPRSLTSGSVATRLT